MAAAVCQREYMVYFARLGVPALAEAHLAQGMARQESAPDGWPRSLVPLFHFWRPLISVVLDRDQPLVLRAVRFIGQGRAAGISTGFLWLPWHCFLHEKGPQAFLPVALIPISL